MSEPFGRLRRFLRELKRRNVYKVAVAYVAVAFVGLQAARLLVPSTTLPGWADEFLIYVAVFGFPIALVVAWAFELTPEGVRRTETPEGEGKPGGSLLYQWVGLALVVALAGGVWYVTTGDGGETGGESAAATDTSRAEAVATDRSIAVLPFDNLSGTEEAEPFVNGIHDDLLTRLSNISDLKVISRTSVLRYRETDLSLPAIADSLGVTWIVEGGVQQAGDQVQVNAQLIEAQEDAHQWAETYRRELTTENLFAVQSDLTKKIARSLEAELTRQEEERVVRRPTDDLEAYRAYQKGRHHWHRHTEESWRRAAEYFDEAIAVDSTYARAYAGLADALSRLAFFGHLEPAEAYRRALRAAQQALALDESLAEAHATLARIRYTYQWDFAGAEAEFQRALELNPNYALGHHAYAVFLARMGRFGEAQEKLNGALELDPLKPRIHNNRGWIAFLARDFHEAVTRYQEAMKLNPHFAMTHRELAWAYVETERYRDAIREAERAVELSLDDYTLASLGFVVGRAGERDRARSVLDSLSDRAERRYVSPTNLALIHLGLGSGDRALDWLERAARDRSAFLVNLGVHPFFDPLRDRPRFQRLLERMGLDTMAIGLDTLAVARGWKAEDPWRVLSTIDWDEHRVAPPLPGRLSASVRRSVRSPFFDSKEKASPTSRSFVRSQASPASTRSNSSNPAGPRSKR